MAKESKGRGYNLISRPFTSAADSTCNPCLRDLFTRVPFQLPGANIPATISVLETYRTHRHPGPTGYSFTHV